MSDFLKTKFDNLSLFVAMVMLAVMIVHMIHHTPDSPALTWAEQTFTTVLGAYIGLTQAARLAWKPQNGGGSNGSQTTVAVGVTTPPPVTSTSDKRVPEGPVPSVAGG